MYVVQDSYHHFQGDSRLLNQHWRLLSRWKISNSFLTMKWSSCSFGNSFWRLSMSQSRASYRLFTELEQSDTRNFTSSFWISKFLVLVLGLLVYEGHDSWPMTITRTSVTNSIRAKKYKSLDILKGQFTVGNRYHAGSLRCWLPVWCRRASQRIYYRTFWNY